jgi:hypothetical protein
MRLTQKCAQFTNNNAGQAANRLRLHRHVIRLDDFARFAFGSRAHLGTSEFDRYRRKSRNDQAGRAGERVRSRRRALWIDRAARTAKKIAAGRI